MGSTNDKPFTKKATLDELAPLYRRRPADTAAWIRVFAGSAIHQAPAFQPYVCNCESGNGGWWPSSQPPYRRSITSEGFLIGFFSGIAFMQILILINPGLLI